MESTRQLPLVCDQIQYNHWWIQGGTPGVHPPNRIQFFHFRICFCQKAYVSEVGAPQREILDPPLYSFNCHKILAIYLIESEPEQIIGSGLLTIRQNTFIFVWNLAVLVLTDYWIIRSWLFVLFHPLWYIPLQKKKDLPDFIYWIAINTW